MSDAAFVYLLRCGDGSLYCGWTFDLERRLAEHQAGSASRYTRSRQPVELAWSLPVASRSEAMREEIRIKRLSRAEKLSLLDGDFGRLLSVPVSATEECGQRPAAAGLATASRQQATREPRSRRGSGRSP